jgi:alkanesulfonate monooxygenase SsuD/methylene tetrahydromethanopterin reductase-like flavin-dependent oxidoreductase (luciferase family)
VKVGIGLPSTIPRATREQVLEWARRADAAGFSTLGTLDRLVYPNHEPLVTLGAAAAVTERIRLMTGVLLVPWRQNAALVAKQAATVHALSGGRFTLGAGLGSRDDDYEASGVPTKGRGRRMDEMLAVIRRVWDGAELGYAGGVGPDVTSDPPELIVGGSADAAFRRAAEYADGWMMGGGAPERFPELSGKLETAWRERGRDGEPRKLALTYFALGDDPQGGHRAVDRRLLLVLTGVRVRRGRGNSQGRGRRPRADRGVPRRGGRRGRDVPGLPGPAAGGPARRDRAVAIFRPTAPPRWRRCHEPSS